MGRQQRGLSPAEHARTKTGVDIFIGIKLTKVVPSLIKRNLELPAGFLARYAALK